MIKEEDEFYLHILDETLAYKVDQIKTVLPEEVGDIQIEKGSDQVTLITCTPYGINSHRLLIRGTRVPYTEGVKDRNQQMRQSVWQWLVEQKVLLLSAGFVIVAICVLVGKTVLKGKNKVRRNRK